MNKYRFKPYGPVLLVNPIKESELLDSGLYKPETAVEKPTKGVVVEVGTDVIGFSVGEVVVFRKYAGVEWEFSGETLLILPVEQVLGFETDQVQEKL